MILKKAKLQKTFFFVIFFSVIISESVLAWKQKWPKIEIPDKTNFEWIAKEIQHNGIDMKIMHVFGPIPSDKTLEFFTLAWSNDNIAPRAFGTNLHLVLSKIIKTPAGQFQFTLELPPNEKNTSAILSLMSLDHAQIHPAAKLDPFLPPGSKILSDTLSIDALILNRTLVAQHTNSVLHHEMRFKQILASKGWLLEQNSNAASYDALDQKDRLLLFFKEKDELSLSLISENGTKIVAVYLRKP